jgi:hypothetical protein
MSSRQHWTYLIIGLFGASACQAAADYDEPPLDEDVGGTPPVDDGPSSPVAGTGPVLTPPSVAGGGAGGPSSAGTSNAGGGAAGQDAGGGGNEGGGGASGGTSSGGTSSGGGHSGGSGAIPHGACLDGIQDFAKAGPFKVTSKRSGSINFYVPGVPAGCKVPVVHLANGTGASCATYLATLQRLATHGFLAACYESANTGAGDQGVKALDTALSTFPELVDNKFGSTGHSQGGQGAFTVLALAEKKYGEKFIYAGLALQPASGFGAQPSGATWQSLYAGIKSPLFMFSGLGTDGLVSQSWVQRAYDSTSKTVEAYFWTARGASHIPVPNGEAQEISIPWFRWKLLGDQAACRAFVGIPKMNPKWAEVAAKNQQPCR